MSERIVSDPSLHGWVEENGKWVWEGGATTGHIEDGTVQGQITTWDVAKTEWTPDSSLTIDSSGDASFSSDISLGSGSPATAETRYANIHILGDDKEFGSRIWMSNSNGDWAVTSFGGGTVDRWAVYSFSQAQNVLQLDGDDGSARFTGKLYAANFPVDAFAMTYAPYGFGIRLSNHGALVPANADGTTKNGGLSLGWTNMRWDDCYLTGSVISTRHGVSIGTRDLIETLSTLRNATKDETTIKGLRDAIGNAVGGLIEKFEAMQAVTQEISDE